MNDQGPQNYVPPPKSILPPYQAHQLPHVLASYQTKCEQGDVAAIAQALEAEACLSPHMHSWLVKAILDKLYEPEGQKIIGKGPLSTKAAKRKRDRIDMQLYLLVCANLKAHKNSGLKPNLKNACDVNKADQIAKTGAFVGPEAVEKAYYRIKNALAAPIFSPQWYWEGEPEDLQHLLEDLEYE